MLKFICQYKIQTEISWISSFSFSYVTLTLLEVHIFSSQITKLFISHSTIPKQLFNKVISQWIFSSHLEHMKVLFFRNPFDMTFWWPSYFNFFELFFSFKDIIHKINYCRHFTFQSTPPIIFDFLWILQIGYKILLTYVIQIFIHPSNELNNLLLILSFSISS